MTRAALPDRRQGIVRKVQWAGRTYHVGFGFDQYGQAREAFADARRTGTDMQALLSDACILLSLLAQHGMTFSEIAAALGENRVEGADVGPPSSVIGAIARIGASEQP